MTGTGREYGLAVSAAMKKSEIHFGDAVRRLGVSYDYLRRIIAGEAIPGQATIRRIDSLLGVSPIRLDVAKNDGAFSPNRP